MIPLFPELVAPLRNLFELAEDGADYLFSAHRSRTLTSVGWRNCNLRTQFERLVTRAGLVPWPFNAIRASRETELAREYPVHIVTAWLGNSPKIALKHYLMVTEKDFELANGALSGAVIGGNGVQRHATTK